MERAAGRSVARRISQIYSKQWSAGFKRVHYMYRSSKGSEVNRVSERLSQLVFVQVWAVSKRLGAPEVS